MSVGDVERHDLEPMSVGRMPCGLSVKHPKNCKMCAVKLHRNDWFVVVHYCYFFYLFSSFLCNFICKLLCWPRGFFQSDVIYIYICHGHFPRLVIKQKFTSVICNAK